MKRFCAALGGVVMGRYLWVVLLFWLLFSGCRGVSLVIGVREPALDTIRTGDRREDVEHLLGSPLWQPGSADGLTYDIYQYPRERPPKPFLGLMLLGMDYITLGMMEGNLRDVKHFEPVKQVAVAYDREGRVRFCSKPWGVVAAGPCRRLRSIIGPESGFPPGVRLPLSPPVPGTTVQSAILQIDRHLRVVIDDRPVEGRTVELAPGYHTLRYAADLAGSIMVGSMFLSYRNTFADVELLPGRHYSLKQERFYPGVGSRVDIFWLEDTESRETLQCSWPWR